MEHEMGRDKDGATTSEADTSAAEYLAGDDRTKTHGYNHLPHRPRRPDQRRQVAGARQSTPAREPQPDAEQVAGEREPPSAGAADIALNKEGPA